MRILFFLPLLAWGQGNELSLRQAVEKALANNPRMEGASASEDAATARIAQAKAGYLPKINFSESFTRSDNPVFVFSSLLTQRQFAAENFALGPLNRPDFLNNFQSQLAADQILFDAGQTRRAVNSARLALQMSQQDTQLAKQRLAAAVVQAYLDAQVSEAQLAATDQARKSAEADLEQAQNRLSAGMATEADVLSVKVYLAQIDEQKANQLAARTTALATLNDALGLPLEAEHKLSTRLQPLLPASQTLATLEQQASTSRPELEQTRLAQKLATNDQQAAKALYLPQVYVRGAVEANRQNFVTKGGANWLVSVGLRWNLFNGGADRAKVVESAAHLRKQEAMAKVAASQVRLEVRRAWAQLEAAQARIATANRALEQAEESLRITQNRYGAGLATMTDLLRTESSRLETQTRLLAAIHFQRLAATHLALATADLTANSEILQ